MFENITLHYMLFLDCQISCQLIGLNLLWIYSISDSFSCHKEGVSLEAGGMVD